jgi:hypothetical protein
MGSGANGRGGTIGIGAIEGKTGIEDGITGGMIGGVG